MKNEQSLEVLLVELSPRLNDGEFVFCVDSSGPVSNAEIVASIEETEGKTIVISADRAAKLGLDPGPLMRWITLDVQSSLQAVGLTARVAGVLANAGIACNVIAGFYHDHLFVPADDAESALAMLEQLCQSMDLGKEVSGQNGGSL